MSKNFSGTLEVGATSFDVTATLAKRGLRVTGHIVFDLDTELVVPLNLLIDSLGTSFTTSNSIWFIDPNGDSVQLLNLTIAETSIDADFTTLDIAAADCGINGAPDVLSMALSEVVEEVDNGGLADAPAAVQSLTRKAIEPIRINEVGNTTDHFGGLLSLSRLPEEGNQDYIERIRDVVARPGGSHYRGLINGINRRLNLSQFDAIKVTMLSSPSGDEDKIRFYLDEKECIIYEEWVPVDRQESGIVPIEEIRTDLSGMTIGKLVDFINTSLNYKAEVLGNADSLAAHLLITDSRIQIREEVVGQEIMVLSSDNVVPGTLTFESIEELRTELDINATLATKGEYLINYADGKIKAFRAPPTTIEVTYTSNRREFLLVWSPVRILNFTSEGAQNLMFNQVEREFYTSELNRYVNGLPTNEAYGIMRDILTAGKFPQFWGE